MFHHVKTKNVPLVSKTLIKLKIVVTLISNHFNQLSIVPISFYLLKVFNKNCSLKQYISELHSQKYASKLLPQRVHFSSAPSKIHFKIAPSKTIFQKQLKTI